MKEFTKSWLTADFPASLRQSTLGFEGLFDLLSETPLNPSNYPVYDLIVNDDGDTSLFLAVAGFKKEELEIEVANNFLVISGKKESKEDVKYIYNGIAKRNFSIKFPMYDNIVVNGADIEDGILTISMSVAEDKKPKTINIK